MNNDNQVDVVLLKPHRHLGVQYIKGDVIHVAVEQLDWLISRGVAIELKKDVKQWMENNNVAMPKPISETKQDKKS